MVGDRRKIRLITLCGLPRKEMAEDQPVSRAQMCELLNDMPCLNARKHTNEAVSYEYT